jgi:signal transduction histidine kinase
MKTLKMKNKFRMYLPGICVLLVSSVILLDLVMFTYRNYKNELIETEQGQLLTMAETIGKSLVHYVEQELESLDLFFDSIEDVQAQEMSLAGYDRKEEVIQSASYYLKQKPQLYDAVSCYGPDNHLIYQEGSMDFSPQKISEEERASICGKRFCQEGRYQMFISRRIRIGGEGYAIVYAMNLSEIYRQIVAPVKIGKGGYSIVKDQELSIIMHHASDQIGMDAIYDRSVRYPQLDLTDLTDWINQQKTEPQGSRIISSYIWNDPELTPQKRIVAYTTIHLPGEDWIVNSTLPYEELDQPLNRMIARLSVMSSAFLLILIVFVYLMTRGRMRTMSQKKEIEYLREINSGMELLRHKEEELQHYQRIQSIGQMSSHIAHEFNNYLTPIIVYGDLLESDPEINDAQREMVKGILDVAGQAAGLSRRLLDFSRQDSGGILTSIRIAEDVRDACKVVSQLTPRYVIFESEIMEEADCVQGYKGMMEQILLNLGNNAFHAMEKEQKQQPDREMHLKISLTPVAATEVPANPEIRMIPNRGTAVTAVYNTIETQAHDRWICLSVSDTGCGIAKDALDKIFEPFYTTKRSGKGTGLGLSVLRNVMTACRGQIQIESEIGRGTIFRLYFPVTDAVGEQNDAASKNGHEIRKVVVVDDEPEVCRSLEFFLKNAGYQCETYDHPAAVLSGLQNHGAFCDAVLTDYAMPSMNGIEFAEMIRKLAPGIRIILMSGMEDARFEWYLKNGIIDEFILKSELVVRLQDTLGRQVKT